MFKLMKIGCLGIIIVLVILTSLAIFGATKNSDSIKNDEKKQVSKEVEKEKTYKIGDLVKVGDVVFKVNKVTTTNKVTAANGYMKYEPDADGAEFLIVNVSVKNKGKEMITTDSSYFKLSKGNTTYSPSNILAADEKFFMYEGINPGLTQRGNVLFEVPKGLKNIKLHVQTGIWGTEQDVIDLK